MEAAEPGKSHGVTWAQDLVPRATPSQGEGMQSASFLKKSFFIAISPMQFCFLLSSRVTQSHRHAPLLLP